MSKDENLPAKRELRVTHDVIPLLDTTKFEHMQRVATVMGAMSLIPDGLKGSPEQTMANCFLVVNFAVSNEMDPFQVAQMVSVVHGKLCFEGKLIHALIEKKLGVRLKYEMTGEPGTEKRGVIVSGQFSDEVAPRAIEGTVADWKVTQRKRDGSGETSAWTPKSYDRMLRYRGAREWCRAYAPGVILGVYSRDEMMEDYEQEYDDGPPEAPKNIDTRRGDSGDQPPAVADAPGDRQPDRDVTAEHRPEAGDGNGASAPANPPRSREAEEAEIVEEPLSAPETGAPAVEAADDDDGPPSAPSASEAPPASADAVLDALERDLKSCIDPGAVMGVKATYAPRLAGMFPPDKEEAEMMIAAALKRTGDKK